MADIFLIQCDAVIRGRRQTWMAERDTERLGLRNTVEDIVSGQVENVSHVYRANAEDGTYRDVTEDVAQAVADALDAPPTGEIKDFLENVLGCHFVADLEREMEAA
jgi:hypothetical protein